MSLYEQIKSQLEELLPGKVGILGFGVEGQSTLKFLQKFGFKNLLVLDGRDQELSDEVLLGAEFVGGEEYLEHLFSCDCIIRSAGVSPLKCEIENFVGQGGKLSSQVELFFELWSGKKVGVTGTLGKGSCVSMIEHVLNKAQIPVQVAGNIGLAVLDLLQSQIEAKNFDPIAVLELSSFQLMNLKKNPEIGVILKTTSEHLDWHRDIDEYIDAKANLVKYQKTDDLCVYYGDVQASSDIANQSQSQKSLVSYDSKILTQPEHFQSHKYFIHLHLESLDVWDLSNAKKIADLDIKDCIVNGDFQLENIGAALAVVLELGVDIATAISAIKTFGGLDYRMQTIAEITSKSYQKNNQSISFEFINDSYATRPDATIAAIKSLKNPSAIILGGSEKNADFTELIEVIEESKQIKMISLIGFTASRLSKLISKSSYQGEIKTFENLELAFWAGINYFYAQDEILNDNKKCILLSPACASFGLFKNYKERALVFNKLIEDFRNI